jgi:hypothetical protein
MIVIQPLIQGLRGLNLYTRVYENKEGYLVVELGKYLNSFWEKDKLVGELIFGNPLTKRDVVYILKEETYEKQVLRQSISEFDLAKVERLIDSCYNFEEIHKVTEWK